MTRAARRPSVKEPHAERWGEVKRGRREASKGRREVSKGPREVSKGRHAAKPAQLLLAACWPAALMITWRRASQQQPGLRTAMVQVSVTVAVQ